MQARLACLKKEVEKMRLLHESSFQAVKVDLKTCLQQRVQQIGWKALLRSPDDFYEGQFNSQHHLSNKSPTPELYITFDVPSYNIREDPTVV